MKNVNQISILLIIVYFTCGGWGSSNRNISSRDASVEGEDELIKCEGETPRSCYNDAVASPLLILRHLRGYMWTHYIRTDADLC